LPTPLRPNQCRQIRPSLTLGESFRFKRTGNRFNAAHAGVGDFDTCFDLVTALPARLMNPKDYGVAPGHPADIVVLDTVSSQGAIRELPDILMGFKNGRRTFERQSPVLFQP
jgi:cytosine deaminase